MSKYSVDAYSAESDINQQILKNLNRGKLMEFDTEKATCACGTKLKDSKSSGICVTCGSVRRGTLDL